MIKTETLKKSMFYYGTKLFNKLRKDIKEVNSLLIFKSKLRDFYLSWLYLALRICSWNNV